jgi:ubiquinone/menaquinone biosynthesis C-methylase UbiE
MNDFTPRSYDFNNTEFVSVYDELPRWSALIGNVLLEHVPLRRNVRLLDVGTGTGFPLIELAQQLGPTCRAYGIDVWRRFTRKQPSLKPA